MREQATAADLAERQRAFAEVQQILGDELPSIYFVASRVTLATSPRVINPTPAPLAPHLLWSADTLAVAGKSGSSTLTSASGPGLASRGRRAENSVVHRGLLTYLVRRLLLAALLVFVVSSAALMLVEAAPGDYVAGFDLDPAVAAAERHRLGLD